MIDVVRVVVVAITAFWGCSALAEAGAKLAVGDKAPQFEAADQDGKIWKLADLSGKKIVLLYFYPKDQTPGCTKEACTLRDQMESLTNQNVVVLGASFDTAKSHKEFIEKQKLNFSLLADDTGKLADLFGARRDANASITKRISFLISLDGKIAHITDNPNPDVHINEMNAAIKKLASTPK